MSFAHPQGLIAVILAVICFYGTTYVVLALNVGWRFGYWVAGATFGALMVLLSIFWIVNPVGPRGLEGHWVPVAASRELSQVTFNGKPLTEPAQYPSGPWVAATPGDEQADAFSSAITNCISTLPDLLASELKQACLDAQALMPPKDKIPVLLGSAVAVQPQTNDIRFAVENGADLAMAVVRPVTIDPRLTKDPTGKLLAQPFRLVAVLNKGSLRQPPIASLAIFLAFFLFHLWGLDRAEKRKLNPAVI